MPSEHARRTERAYHARRALSQSDGVHIPSARGSTVKVDEGTGRACVVNADTVGDDPQGVASLIDTLLHGPPNHLGLIGAHSPGDVQVIEPARES